jgi:hypothetical protein
MPTASASSAGSSLTPHPASPSISTVSATDSAHTGLSPTSDGLSSGLTPSATATHVTTDHVTADHSTPIHH